MIKYLIILCIYIISLKNPVYGQQDSNSYHQEYKLHKFSVQLSYLSTQFTYGRRISEFSWLNFGVGIGRTYYISNFKDLQSKNNIFLYYQNFPLDFLGVEIGLGLTSFKYTPPVNASEEISFFVTNLGLFLKYKFISFGGKAYYSILKWNKKNHIFYTPAILHLTIPF